jgi:hypothetical protein
MKAWRNNPEINKQRAAELATGRIVTPTARQQMQAARANKVPSGFGGSWLLAGLFMRAGLISTSADDTEALQSNGLPHG